MDGVFLTVMLSIVVPLLLVLLWLFFIYFVLKKSLFSKNEPMERDLQNDSVPSRLDPVFTSSAIDPLDVNVQYPSCNQRSTTVLSERLFSLPPYSTLPKNSTRGLVRNSILRHTEGESSGDGRYGYRLSSENFSPFTRNDFPHYSDVMREVSLYCDRYIEDAIYQHPPPYESRENVENSHPIRIASSDESGMESSLCTYGSETWI